MSYTPNLWKTGDIITAQKLNNMENAMHTILSDYIQTNWVDGEIISAEKLNKLENAIKYINLDYTKTVWKNDDVITASLLNNMENGIVVASADKTWEEMNWSDIIASTRTGKYKSFNVGNLKELDLGKFGAVHMQIAGIDRDILAVGNGYAPLTLIVQECIGGVSPGSDTYWPDSVYHTYLHDVIWPNLPQIIRDNIKAVVKYTNTFNDGSLIQNFESVETLWAPSFYEVRHDNTGVETAGVGYPELFSDEEARIKLSIVNNYPYSWLLRSASTPDKLRTVTPTGVTARVISSSQKYRCVFGFCL